MRTPETEDPPGLWSALEGHDAITVSHHSGGGPVPTDWSHHNPRFEPVVEIVSIHGNSEAWGALRMIYRPVKGRFVQDALSRGYKLGFVGSGDTHNGHPGMGDPSAPTAGLAGILAAERTREGVFEALRARRVFATTGPRIVILFWVEGGFMGEEVAASDEVAYRGEVWAQERIDRVEVIRDGVVVATAHPDTLHARIEGTDSGPLEDEGYYYLRLTQFDEAQAWSSPVFYHRGDRG